MSLNLDAIKARDEAATPGPWEWETDSDLLHLWKDAENHVLSAWSCETCAKRGARCLHPSLADAEFIAHARTDVPALVAEVARLRIAVDWLYAEADDKVRDTFRGLMVGDGPARRKPALYCGQAFDGWNRNHHSMKFLCEKDRGHDDDHGIPRWNLNAATLDYEPPRGNH